jgi:hypothetical protein
MAFREQIIQVKTHVPVPVAARSNAFVLAAWLVGSWVRIPLGAWMFVFVFLFYVNLCR